LARWRNKAGIGRRDDCDGWRKNTPGRVHDGFQDDFPLHAGLAQQLGIDGERAGQDLRRLLKQNGTPTSRLIRTTRAD
jgi:hypothetical protein